LIPPTQGFLPPVQGRFEWGSTADRCPCHLRRHAAALSSLDMGHVACRLGGDTAQECVARIDFFGTEVIAKRKS